MKGLYLLTIGRNRSRLVSKTGKVPSPRLTCLATWEAKKIDWLLCGKSSITSRRSTYKQVWTILTIIKVKAAGTQALIWEWRSNIWRISNGITNCRSNAILSSQLRAQSTTWRREVFNFLVKKGKSTQILSRRRNMAALKIYNSIKIKNLSRTGTWVSDRCR